MSAEQIEFLQEYDAWKAERKLQRDDLSPETFLVERARAEALERLIEIDEIVKGYNEADDPLGMDCDERIRLFEWTLEKIGRVIDE